MYCGTFALLPPSDFRWSLMVPEVTVLPFSVFLGAEP